MRSAQLSGGMLMYTVKALFVPVAAVCYLSSLPALSLADAAYPADTGTLQEVVVTARRFSEDLQNVPIAVTALSASTIETQDVTNLQDLNSFVPNFKISADRATSSTINVYIRGVGQSDPLWGIRTRRRGVHRRCVSGAGAGGAARRH